MPYETFDKYDGRCSYGGKVLHRTRRGERHPQGWEIDHGQPRARAGVDDRRNHRLACWACNRFKSDMDAAAWRYRIQQFYGGECPKWRDGNPQKMH